MAALAYTRMIRPPPCGLAVLTFALMTAGSGRADAAEVCPPYRQDLPLRCAKGYLHATPAGLLIPLGEVHNDHADSPRLGMNVGLGAGIFRTLGRVGLALGARLGYGFTRQRFDEYVETDKYLHAGPELRLGGVGRRFFAFALIRGGYSQRYGLSWRTTDDHLSWIRGGHVGVGAGAWGHLGTRFMVGGEIVSDVLMAELAGVYPLTLSLSLGLWL